MTARRTTVTTTLASQRGNTFVRVLLIVLGSILIMSGLILSIATVGITLDGDPSILILLPFALSSMLGGGYIIATQARGNRGSTERSIAPTQDMPVPVPLEDGHRGERVASVTPLTETPTFPLSPTDEPGQDKGDDSSTDDITHLVFRSSDLFATLRDLVRHENAAAAPSSKGHLVSMLEASGIMGWNDAPACEGGRLSRNGRFWIRLGVDGLTDSQYDTLVAAEAALGINQDLPAVRTRTVDDPKTQDACLRLMRSLATQDIKRGELTDEGLRTCYHTTDASGTKQDWVVRSVVCNAAECAVVPFRVVYDLRLNIETGLAALSLEIPRPTCMAIFTPDTTLQAGLARAYALRLAVLLATQALDASDRVRRVVVNCHEHAKDETLVSLDIDRSIVGRLREVASGTAIETGFPTDGRIRAAFDGSWFAPVEPFVALDDETLVPDVSRILPELDTRPAPEAIARTCHAKRICDLGINESAPRVAAWEALRGRLGSTTEQAVSALMAERNAASDITVAEACNRTAQALVDGQVELDDLDAIGTLFRYGSALDRAVTRANKLLDEADGPEDPEAAVKILEEALAPIEDMGAYLDDETTVYRYFGSVAERIEHNAVIDEDGRDICLVPDSYFNAHSNASIALGMLDRNEEALAHAEVCMRLAPTSTYATMRKVRILEEQSRIYEAADLIIAALRHAVTPRDAAICHYRLAYMEWKLGREDLAAACYQRSLTWDTEMAAQAREELDDLLANTPDLKRPTDEQADALLAREGIPLGCVRTDGENTLAAAVACMDGGALISARPLMAVLFGMNNDDVVMGVYRSLNVLP